MASLTTAIASPIRVLHVDDDTAFADLVADALERTDDRIDVTRASDATEGLTRLADADPGIDCVVSDYEMPGRDGIEFLETVREEHPDLPFILFTGKGSEAVASEAISTGVTDYLQKEGGTDQFAILANRITNVVEGYRSQRALAERRRRLETLIDNLPGVVYRTRNDPAWPMEFFAGEVEKLTGYPAAVIEENEVSFGEDLIHPDDRDEVWASVQASLDATEPFELTYRIVTRDGTTKWVWERGRGVRSSEGDLVAIEGFITDVTERKRRERRLERLHEATRTLFRAEDRREVAQVVADAFEEIVGHSSAVVRLVDGDDLRAVAVTEGATELLGDRPPYPVGNGTAGRAFAEGEALVIDDVSDLDDGYDRGEARAGLYVPIGDHGTISINSTTTGAFGEADVRIAELFASSAGAAIERIEQAADLREQSRRIEALHAATRRLTSAETETEIAELAIQAAEETLGFPITAVRLLDDDGRLHPVALSDGMVRELGPDRPAYEVGEPTAGVAFGRGETVVYEDLAAIDDGVERTPGGSMYVPIGEYGVMSVSDTEVDAFDQADIDVAEILAAHAAAALDRVTRTRTLRRQNERLEEFASIVAHDLRNPLEVASGRLELLRGSCDDDHLDVIEGAHDRMGWLIDDLLTLARADDLDADLGPVDVGGAVERAWRTVETDDATLAVASTRAVRADADRLTQLFENLVRNAVEHAGPDVTVTVGLLDDGDREGEGEGFYVEDDGPGIPAGERKQVFESGYSTADGGTGFGLDIVTRIAEAHEWGVSLVEGEAGGARFEITGVEFVGE